jgi:hypothetical protein
VATLQQIRGSVNGTERVIYDRIWELPDSNWAMVHIIGAGQSGYPALARLNGSLEPISIYTSVHGLNATQVVSMVSDEGCVWALHGWDESEGKGVSIYNPDSDSFQPMTTASGLASDSVNRVIPLEAGTFALYTEPSLGIGRFVAKERRWHEWQPYLEHVPNPATAIREIGGSFFILSQGADYPGTVDRLTVISSEGELLSSSEIGIPDTDKPLLLSNLGATGRSLFMELVPSDFDSLPGEWVTKRVDLDSLEVTDFDLLSELDSAAFTPRSALPFFNCGNMALFTGNDGEVAVIDELTGESQVLGGLHVFEDVEWAWSHQGEIWISSHHERGLLPGQWKLCSYDAAGGVSTDFGITPGFIDTVLRNGGGVRVLDVESRGADMWLALERGLFKQVRQETEGEGQWFALMRKNQRPVLASQLQFYGEDLLVRTRQGWLSLHLESEDDMRLLACANPLWNTSSR